MANIRAPNLDFTGTSNPNRIPVSVAVSLTGQPTIMAGAAAQRAPSSLNFALGVRPNGFPLSAPVLATSGETVITPSPNTAKPAPRLELWGVGGGGGGGGTNSYPICG